MTNSRRDQRGKRVAGEIVDIDTRDPVGSPKGNRWAKRRAVRIARRRASIYAVIDGFGPVEPREFKTLQEWLHESALYGSATARSTRGGDV